MKAKLSLIAAAALLAGCAQMPPAPSINSNGAIKWANGVTEEMHISASGSTLTFAAPQSLFNPGGITIFSRIDSARNGNCEHYYSEQAVKTRMQICDNGEVTLIVEGQVINVGALARYMY
ncbi:hypothetical protein ACFFLZ_16235 [Photobacterium aphoticum]|uniref:Lipoprotein n=2 Tax=Photobacterium aphoticum TaxID=754436 RepID=A0A090QQZ6_9GAMM|nr:hypothetical protein [Photobacterium aphoticum]PSU58592.1 hypothetical protein C9I90_06500 [Photobacterium aphoticum]GAL05575.1 hypothetical protein JCM19237_665 [Photobacterium aphoticum]GHA47894.1 hypothetical protein GCM10007086_21920 [Photobacterium aphoticum]